MSHPSPGASFSRFAVLTAICTLFLICVGGVVTSRGVGMAVPDWPSTYGYNMFFFPIEKWVGGIREEHTHRLVASGVGLLTTILALWLYGIKSRPVLRWIGLPLALLGITTCLAVPSRLQDGLFLGLTGAVAFGASYLWPRGQPAALWLRRLGLIAFVAVVLQGILGGLRVTAMKDEIGVVHATLAQLFFCLVCAIALFTGKWWQTRGDSEPAAGRIVRWSFVVATTLVFLQLVLGATMRHQHAGLAIPDFPTAYGRLWPDMSAEAVARYNQGRVEVNALNPITAFQMGLHMSHRIMALLVAVAVGSCCVLARRQLGGKARISRLALAWAGLIFLQIFLGAATVWTGKSADLATAHVAVGALTLATGALASIIAMRAPVMHPAGPIGNVSRASASARVLTRNHDNTAPVTS